jgi:hypothetical protein
MLSDAGGRQVQQRCEVTYRRVAVTMDVVEDFLPSALHSGDFLN